MMKTALFRICTTKLANITSFLSKNVSCNHGIVPNSFVKAKNITTSAQAIPTSSKKVWRSWNRHGLPANTVVKLKNLNGDFKYKVSCMVLFNRCRFIISEGSSIAKMVSLKRGRIYTKQQIDSEVEALTTSGLFKEVDLHARINSDGTIGLTLSYVKTACHAPHKHGCGMISKDRDDQWIEVISWEPRAFIYHNFLSDEECQHLIDLAKPSMKRSRVRAYDSKIPEGKVSEYRTSSGTFFTRGKDEIIKSIETRIANFTCIPKEHGEGLQVLHYEVGQKFGPHFDYSQNRLNIENGGQRIATVLMYLSDVEEGGETVFPSAKVDFSALPYWYDHKSEYGKAPQKGLSVKPKKRDALLFWGIKPDHVTLDPSSLHAGSPVIKGHKWCATQWMHVNEYRISNSTVAA